MTPKIKTKRKDVLRKPEILQILKKAGEVGPWLQCLVALATGFGKRISELLAIEYDDIRVDEEYIYIRFHVLKKTSRIDSGVRKPFLKRLTLNHYTARYIVLYLKQQLEEEPEGTYLFSYRGKQVTRHRAKYYLKKTHPKAWWHLFRHSLATEMAEHDATSIDLVSWFDWERSDTALSYIRRGTRLTKKWSDRETW